MKKTVQERILFWKNKKAKQYPYLKFPLAAAALLCLIACRVWKLAAGNGKKLMGIGLAGFFFLISSSFCYPEEIPLPEFYEELAQQRQDDPDIDTLEKIWKENQTYLEREKEEQISRQEPGETADGAGKTDETEEELPFDKNDWRLMLVNKQHTIPEDYEFPLGTIKGNLKCDERILEDLRAMLQAAKEDGIDVNIDSPYRDYKTQKYLFERKMKKYLSKGYSYMEAYRVASTVVTVPNASEHQIGLAIDFNCKEHPSLNAAFADTETGKWLREHCTEYGFILRYPKEKEYITGIIYEPWHFRYVGKEAAEFLTEKGITLEEFWEEYLN